MFGDCHVHIALNGNDFATAEALHAGGVNEASVREHFLEYQKRGISFLREGGDAWGVSAIARHIAPEYGIDYITPLFAIHKKGHYGSIVGRGFETLRDFAALVDEAASSGADFIKIMTTGIMDFNTYGNIILGAPLEAATVKEMVHIAHECGLAVCSHTNGAGAVLDAIEAGVQSIEHGNYLNEECIQAFAESRTIYVPTASVSKNLIGTGRFDDEVLARVADTSKQNIILAMEAGVVLALGSDAGAGGVEHGDGLIREYAFFQECIADRTALDTRLEEGEHQIKETFRRT